MPPELPQQIIEGICILCHQLPKEGGIGMVQTRNTGGRPQKSTAVEKQLGGVFIFKELWTHFRPVNPMEAAEMELCHLTLAGNSRLSNYLVHFNTLASSIKWGDAVLCLQFYDGLLDQLKDQIAILGNQIPSETWS